MPDTPRIDADMAAYYAEGREQARLTTWGRLERLRTEVLLRRVLPRPPATILDCGGGPGAYAHRLADEGYAVHLLDPVALHVDQARADARTPLAGAEVGDARALPHDDATFDAVLLLGPLYHLTEREDRLHALREAHRVLRPGGVLAAAAISRFAPTLDGFFRGFFDDPGFAAQVVRELPTGRHDNPTRHPGWFTTAYFHRPEEFEAELRNAELAPELYAIETPAAFLPDLDERLNDPAKRRTLLEAIERIEREPSLIGASPHILATATK